MKGNMKLNLKKNKKKTSKGKTAQFRVRRHSFRNRVRCLFWKSPLWAATLAPLARWSGLMTRSVCCVLQKDSMRIDIPHGCARESARLACNERLGWRRVQGRQRAKINKSPPTGRLLLSEKTQIVGQIFFAHYGTFSVIIVLPVLEQSCVSSFQCRVEMCCTAGSLLACFHEVF